MELNGIKPFYYEKAFDSTGEGLLPGDKIKILEGGEIHEVCEIFQGDLRLDSNGCCHPELTVKIK